MVEDKGEGCSVTPLHKWSIVCQANLFDNSQFLTWRSFEKLELLPGCIVDGDNKQNVRLPYHHFLYFTNH